MEEKTLNQNESLELITRIMSENRARLSCKNSDILWMTGVALLLICIGMLVARRYLADSQVMWFTFLMPVSAWLIALRYREKRVKTFLDEMFHAAWMYMWLFPALLSGVYLFSNEGNYNVVFLIYLASLFVGLVIILEVLLKLRYASSCLIGGCSMAYLYVTSMNGSIGYGILSFILFCLIGLVLAGCAMQWQVKHRIKNPVTSVK